MLKQKFMKRLFLILVLLIAFSRIFSQTIFQKTFGDLSYSEYAYSAIEVSSGSFILTNLKSTSGSNMGSPYLIKVSKNGGLISSKFIQDTSINFSYTSILEFNSRIILFGALISDNGSFSDSLVFSEIDTNLNIIKTMKVHFANNIGSGNLFIDNFKDSLLIVSGHLDLVSQPTIYNSYAITIDTAYDVVVINTSLGNGFYRPTIYNLVYNNTDSLFYSFLTINSSFSYKISMNIDLVVDSVYIQNSLNFIQPTYLQGVDNKNYLLTWDKKKRAMFYRLNSSFDTISSIQLGNNNLLVYPAPSRSLSANSKFLYAGITEGLNPNNIWWGLQNSNYYVAKLDSNGNTIWDKRIGSNGNYYILYDVLATKDGGCLLSGGVYDYTSNTFQKDIFIVKLDSNGTTTWTKDIKLPASKITVFPNPSSKELNIKLSEGNQRLSNYRIYDLQGKLILQNSINSPQNKIDIQNLSSGVYIIEAQTNSGAVYRTKFVKE
jgi:hypothetical protein